MPYVYESWTGGKTAKVRRSIDIANQRDAERRERKVSVAMVLVALVAGALAVAATGCGVEADVHKAALDLRDAIVLEHSVTAPVSTLSTTEVAAVNSLRSDTEALADKLVQVTSGESKK